MKPEDRLKELQDRVETELMNDKQFLAIPPDTSIVPYIVAKTASIIRAERLDRPDREKIAEVFAQAIYNSPLDRVYIYDVDGAEQCRKWADKAIALIPDVDKVVAEIFKAYDPYVKALEEENGVLAGFASTHGWHSSRVEFGKQCRKKIKALKARGGK